MKKNTDNRILCLIIYAIYQCRKNMKDKILVCSSSNSVADSISLDLLRMKEYIDKLDILRIYAKNQELMNQMIFYHYLNIIFKILKMQYYL